MNERLEAGDHLYFQEANKRMNDPNDANYEINFV